MSQLNCTTTSRRFKHITVKERYQIEILLKEKKSPSEIAKLLGKHKRTIEREIARGTVRMLRSDLVYVDRYCADTAERIYRERAANKGACLKIGHDHGLADYIEKKIIKEGYTPDAVIGEIRAKGLKFKTSICTKTLYNYIDKEVFANITNKNLPVKRVPKKNRHKRVRVAHNNLKGRSIEERPAAANTREEAGHWEMDCVVSGKGKGKAALLVLTERKFRKEITRKMPEKTQKSVKKTLDRLEREYGARFSEVFKTITVDNGSEFLNSVELESSIRKPGTHRTKIYYAHPFSAWERGSNENANKLIRRFIPKGTDISKLKQKDIRRIENWMNNYPRKIHGYKSANEMAKMAV
ncbi:MAG: IS30 family transposase [Bacillota bacterium]